MTADERIAHYRTLALKADAASVTAKNANFREEEDRWLEIAVRTLFYSDVLQALEEIRQEARDINVWLSNR